MGGQGKMERVLYAFHFPCFSSSRFFCTVEAEKLFVFLLEFNGETGTFQQPFHDPAKRAVFLRDMTGEIGTVLLFRRDNPLKICFRRLLFPVEDDIQQNETSAGLQGGMDFPQSNRFPGIGQMMERKPGNDSVESFRRIFIAQKSA